MGTGSAGSVVGENSFYGETRGTRRGGRHVAKRSSDPRVAYPEVNVQVRDLVRGVDIVAPFALRGFSIRRKFVLSIGQAKSSIPALSYPSRKGGKTIDLYCYIKVLRVKPVYQQMTLSPKLGVVGISTLWHFRLPLPIQMFIKVASSPRLSGIGMPSPILWSHPLKMQWIELLSSLLWWELGTNSLITGPGEWLSFRRFTSKLSWSWSWSYFQVGGIKHDQELYAKVSYIPSRRVLWVPVGTHRAPIGALCEGSSMRLYRAGILNLPVNQILVWHIVCFLSTDIKTYVHIINAHNSKIRW